MTAPRVYTIGEILGMLRMSRTTFWEMRSAGRLPFVVEILPRLGRVRRYRADLIDRYLAAQWNGGRGRQFFASR